MTPDYYLVKLQQMWIDFHLPASRWAEFTATSDVEVQQFILIVRCSPMSNSSLQWLTDSRAL